MKNYGKKLRVDMYQPVNLMHFFSMEDTGDMTISEEDKRRFINLVDPKSADLAKNLVDEKLDFTYTEYYDKDDEFNYGYNRNTFSTIMVVTRDCGKRIIDLNDCGKRMSDDDVEFIKSIVTRCGDLRAGTTFVFRAREVGALREYIDEHNNTPNKLPMSIRKMLYNMYGKLSASDKLLFEIGEKDLDWDNL